MYFKNIIVHCDSEHATKKDKLSLVRAMKGYEGMKGHYLPNKATAGKQHGRVIWAVLNGTAANGKSKYNSARQTA